MTFKKKSENQAGSWIDEIENYSRQIWLAGLGAYSKISKDGSKLFDRLVKDGEKAEKSAKQDSDQQSDGTGTTAKEQSESGKSRVDLILDKALGKWGEFEEAFDKRFSSAISRLGVPSRAEVEALTAKVEELSQQLQALTASPSRAKSNAKPAGQKPKVTAKSADGSSAAKARRSTAKAPVKSASRTTKKAAPAQTAAPAKPAEDAPAQAAVASAPVNGDS